MPAAARAMSAICVESAVGMPIARRTASAVMPIVKSETMAIVSTMVARAKRRRSVAPSWPSWPIAVAGASVPVASAIATGNDRSTARTADPSGPVTRAWSSWATGAANPCTRTATALATNSSVIAANTSRPPWPNHVKPATASSMPRPSGIRQPASPGR